LATTTTTTLYQRGCGGGGRTARKSLSRAGRAAPRCARVVAPIELNYSPTHKTATSAMFDTQRWRQRAIDRRPRDVSYSSFNVQKDDSYSGRGRVAAQGETYICGTAAV